MEEIKPETKKAAVGTEVKIEKVTLNIGVGETSDRLKKMKGIVETLTGRTAVLTRAKKRVQIFGIRKRDQIGAKITMRGEEAKVFLKNALSAADNRFNERSIDKDGNFSFGVREYIDFPGAKYDPTIGLFGFDVAVTLTKGGRRVALRRRKRTKVPHKHKVTKKEALEFVKKNYEVELV